MAEDVIMFFVLYMEFYIPFGYLLNFLRIYY